MPSALQTLAAAAAFGTGALATNNSSGNMSSPTPSAPTPSAPTPGSPTPSAPTPGAATEIVAFTAPSSTQKCKWEPERNRCEFLWKNYPTSDGTAVGKWKKFENTKELCEGKTNKVNCNGAGSDCTWVDSRQACQYKDQWDENSVTGRTTTGCAGAYSIAPAKDCDMFSTETTCTAESNCFWKERPTPPPTPPTPPPPQTFRWWGDAMKCAPETERPQMAGECRESMFRRLCGADSNVTMEDEGPNVLRAVMMLKHVCGTGDYMVSPPTFTVTGDDAAFTACAEGQGMCSAMLTADLALVKKLVTGPDLTAAEKDTIFSTCLPEQFCTAYSDVMKEYLLESYGGSNVNCDEHSANETSCTTAGCVYLSVGSGATLQSKCRSKKEARSDVGASNYGSADCWMTKLQKVRGLADLTDAQVKTKYEEDWQKAIDCNAKTDMATCTASCKVEKHTSISCDSTKIMGRDAPERCVFDEESGMTTAKNVEMWLAYFPAVNSKEMEALEAIAESCKTNTDRATCEATVYSSAETASVAAAEATGVASDASQMDLTKSVGVLLAGVFVASM